MHTLMQLDNMGAIMTELTGNVLWQEPLWESVLRHYSKEPVEKLSLAWQEEYGANVTLLLWCVWLSKEGIGLSKEVLDDVVATVKETENATLWPLRRARKALVEQKTMTKVQQGMVKKQILAAELSIEKILAHKLQDLTQKYSEVMRDNKSPLGLEDYLAKLRVPGVLAKSHQYLALIDAD